MAELIARLFLLEANAEDAKVYTEGRGGKQIPYSVTTEKGNRNCELQRQLEWQRKAS